jgi:hypothetical protein
MSLETRLKEIDEDLAFFEKYVKALRRERNSVLTMMDSERKIRSQIAGFGVREADGSRVIPFEERLTNEKFEDTKKEKN